MLNDYISDKVLGFYEKLPFNCSSSPDIAASEIKNTNMLTYYFRGYEALFSEEKSVLEIGCGTGWMSNMITYYHGAKVVGVDFNPKAISFAKETNSLLGGDTTFIVSDLFDYESDAFDIVVSIGVLHHTKDCIGGIKKACGLTKQSGHVIIGLYNLFGRRPFLNHFDKLKSEGYSEEQLFDEYRKLDKRHRDETLAKSWFYDQVLHPHETLHTLEEVINTFDASNVKIAATSINNYNEFESIKDLMKLETQLYDKGMAFLENQKYYSGLFIVIGQAC